MMQWMSVFPRSDLRFFMKSFVRTLFAGLLAVLWIAPVFAVDAPKTRILMLTQSKGFQHGSVRRPEKEKLAPAEVAMIQLGKDSGLFEVVCTQDAAADFTKANLANYDIVAFYTTGELPIAKDDFDYFLKEWLTQPGKGFIGFHSATDTYGNFEPYWDLVGGTFNGHPWGSGSNVTISVHEPDHPAVKAFGGEFDIKDEIYQYKHWQPQKVRVLASLNMAKTSLKKPYHVPVMWVKEVGEGKVFYTNLGHNEATWTNKKHLDSIVGAVKWIRGVDKGDAKPNPELSEAQEKKAKEDAGDAK